VATIIIVKTTVPQVPISSAVYYASVK